MIAPRVQERGSFRCEGGMIEFSRLHAVVIQGVQPAKCSLSIAAGLEFSTPKVIPTFFAGRAFAGNIATTLCSFASADVSSASGRAAKAPPYLPMLRAPAAVSLSRRARQQCAVLLDRELRCKRELKLARQRSERH